MADESLIHPQPVEPVAEDPTNPVVVNFVNVEGGGFAASIEIPSNMTIASFFRAKFPGKDPKNYSIRINHNPVRASQTLEEGDSVVVTPTKIAGAGGFLA